MISLTKAVPFNETETETEKSLRVRLRGMILWSQML